MAPSDDELARWRAVTDAALDGTRWQAYYEAHVDPFIALAAAAMPALLDEVERLRRLVAAWATEPDQ